MSFWVVCPGCQGKLQVAEQFRGRVLRCTGCQQTFAARQAATAPPAQASGAGQPAPPAPAATQRARQEEAPGPPPGKSFWVICPGCQARLQVAEQFRGK